MYCYTYAKIRISKKINPNKTNLLCIVSMSLNHTPKNKHPLVYFMFAQLWLNMSSFIRDAKYAAEHLHKTRYHPAASLLCLDLFNLYGNSSDNTPLRRKFCGQILSISYTFHKITKYDGNDESCGFATLFQVNAGSGHNHKSFEIPVQITLASPTWILHPQRAEDLSSGYSPVSRCWWAQFIAPWRHCPPSPLTSLAPELCRKCDTSHIRCHPFGACTRKTSRTWFCSTWTRRWIGAPTSCWPAWRWWRRTGRERQRTSKRVSPLRMPSSRRDRRPRTPSRSMWSCSIGWRALRKRTSSIWAFRVLCRPPPRRFSSKVSQAIFGRTSTPRHERTHSHL